MQPTQRERVLSLLRVYTTGVTTNEFLRQRIPRFSARIQELRDSGFIITTERVREGQYRFKLVSEPGTVGRSMGNAAVPASGTLFDSKPQGTTRSAITGDVMDDAA